MTRVIQSDRITAGLRHAVRASVIGGVAALASLLPAQAGSFRAPDGCETYLTVQARGCRVSNHYQCAADPAGDKWRADFDEEGPFFLSRVNNEAEWVESIELGPQKHQSLKPGATDPASFSDLLSSGLDRFDFHLSHDDGTDTHVTGQDRQTGKTVTIDGVGLKQTEFEFTETDVSGNILRKSRGFEYIHPEWRLFFSGPSDFWDGESWIPFDGSPVKFILSGQPGFASTQPIFECGALMSEASPDARVQEAAYGR